MAVTDPTPYASPAAPQAAVATKAARLWPGIVLVAIFWAFVVAIRVFDLTIAGVFLSGMAASLLLALSFSIWWLTNRTVSLGERVFDFLAVVIGGIVAGIWSDPSNGPIGVIFMGRANGLHRLDGLAFDLAQTFGRRAKVGFARCAGGRLGFVHRDSR